MESRGLGDHHQDLLRGQGVYGRIRTQRARSQSQAHCRGHEGFAEEIGAGVRGRDLLPPTGVAHAIEETVRAMNLVINQGWAFYWGTSQWSAAELIEACEVADRLGLIRPIVEQTIYSILDRNKVDFEYVELYKKYRLGLTSWSPLAYGALTGKYSSGAPEGSRLSSGLWKSFTPDFADRVAKGDKLKPMAKRLGISMAELALAWCVSNENVSTVMLGAKTLAQLEQNLKAIEALDKITPEVKAEIDALVPFVPELSKPDGMEMMRAKHL